MKSMNKIWNTIKDFNLIKYEIMNGSIESHKFRLVLDFDGIIVKSKTMTINDLAKIVTEGFKCVDEKIDDVRQEINTKFDDMRVYMDNRFDKIEQRLDVVEDRLDRNKIY